MTGLCECGCGQPAPLARQSRTAQGIKRGDPLRFISGHRARLPRAKKWEVEEQDRGFDTPCQIWMGGKFATGYGCASSDTPGVQDLAHRVAWERHHGMPVPTGFVIHHRCEQRDCVNADHLEALTHSEHNRTHRSVSDDRIIAGIRNLGHRLGRAPQMLEWDAFKTDGMPCSRTVMLQFGSWAAAVTAAGFDGRTRGRYDRSVKRIERLAA